MLYSLLKQIIKKGDAMKKRRLINTLCLFMIMLGGLYLSNTQDAYAESKAALAATCQCANGSMKSSCSGDNCECNDDGTCSSCDRFLGIFKCK
jgi:hypothetical protein